MLSAKENELLHSSQPLFHEWYLEDIIGEGSSGTVYKITDNNGNFCALKVIPISVEDETTALHINEQDPVSTNKYLDEMTDEILTEVKVMQQLEYMAGIVHYQDYDVIEKEDFFLRLILIKMDLLKPLNKVLRSKESEFSKREIAVMGIDLLTSLSECRKHNIIHRDIKPSNIFVTQDNRYLLGDFGSARLLEKTMMASHKGTLAYMAPEVVAGQSFNATVDIYSLGLMMYQLLNNRRLPFLDDSFKFSDIESAVEKRLSGASLPYPKHADDNLGSIICKMCAYLPKDRYSSSEECMEDLKHYLNHNGQKRKVKKNRIPVICTLFLALLSAAVAVFTIISKTDRYPIPGISSGNVNSSGAIACDKNWLYYSQDIMGARGIRIAKNGNQKEVLCDYTMHDINVTDDYLIFSSPYTAIYDEDSSEPSLTFITGLYRIDKSGEHLTCLDDSNVVNPIVYGKYIYYLREEEDHNSLCKIPVQGGKVETLSEFSNINIPLFYPYKDKLYISDPEKGQLISLDIKNGTKNVIMEDYIYYFCIENDLLYLLTPGNIGFSNKIYIHKIDSFPSTAIHADDSSAKVITFPFELSEFNVSNEMIYASSYASASLKKQSKTGIWRINNDGSGLTQIYTGTNIKTLQLIDQKLYFEEDVNVYYMDLDGKNIHKMSDMTLSYILE